MLSGTTGVQGAGNALENLLRGNDGSNRLLGQDGEETLAGGAGNDSLTGVAAVQFAVLGTTPHPALEVGDFVVLG